MKQLLPLTLLLSAFALIIASCHKNNDDNSISFQNLAGTYKVTGVVINDGSLSFNFYDSIDVCQKDDLFEFNKDSTFDYVDAGMVCTPEGSFNSHWSLKGNVLTLPEVSQSGTAIVKSLDSKTLVLVSADSSYTPAVITTETFTRQ